MAASCKVLKAGIDHEHKGHFAAIVGTVRSARQARMAGDSENSAEKENGHRKQSPRKDGSNVIPRKVLGENNALAKAQPKMDTPNVESRAEVIQEMLKTEEHHVIEVVRDTQWNLQDVIWCPVYLRPDAKGRARGGDELRHHVCKTCKSIGFHLLYDGEKYRPCLRCAGWSETEIPSWYYHVSCTWCKLHLIT